MQKYSNLANQQNNCRKLLNKKKQKQIIPLPGTVHEEQIRILNW